MTDWTKHGKGKVGRYDSHPSGWQIRHCGHPTAHWPWYALAPTGERVCSESGFAWRKLAEAHEHVDQAIAGERVLSYARWSGCGREIYGRLVWRCYACDAPAAGRAIPGGDPRTPSKPACERHRWAELGADSRRRLDGAEPMAAP